MKKASSQSDFFQKKDMPPHMARGPLLEDRMMRYASVCCPNPDCMSESLARLQRHPDMWKCRVCGTVLFDAAAPKDEED